MDFTVAIPTYNGSATLPLVLNCLQKQINTEKIHWEVIVIDNNSQDNTCHLVKEFLINWPAHVSLRYFLEEKQGLAYARWRAIDEAKGEFVGFLDDDNLPTTDWVYQAYIFGTQQPKLGAYGGEIQGNFEVTPPEDFEKAKKFLAVRKYADKATKFEVGKLRLPPGAGLVVRKQAWLESVPKLVTSSKRGGEDYEISLHMNNHGWEIWYNPAMKIQHLIPAWRMEKGYLLSIAHLYGLCTCQIYLMTKKAHWQKFFILFKIIFGALMKIILHLIKYRQAVLTNLGISCEMLFLIGQMLSPFYYIKEKIIVSK